MGELCRRHGLLFLVDSAQTAGVFPIDMQAMHISALAFTGHKGLYGPQGTGGFVLRPELAAQLTPLIAGGTGSIPGTVIGALIIAVIGNGLDLLGVSSYWQDIVKGAIIVVAVLLDRNKKRQ